MPVIAAIVLLILTAICGLYPEIAREVAGRRPLAVPSPPDTFARDDGEGAGSFFADRNVVVVHIAEDTTVKRFLEINRMELDGVREDLAGQLGVDLAHLDAHILQAGSDVRIRLTPLARER